MKKIVPLLLIIFLVIDNVIAQSIEPAPYYQMVTWNSSQYKSFKLTGGSANPNYNTTFRLLWPTNYDSSMVSTTKYPLILMLHGAGESALGNAKFGTYPSGDPRRYNNDHQLLHQGYEYMAAVNNGKWPGFVLFPQNIYGNWTSSSWILADAIEIVQTLSKTLKIDPDRIYIAGLSDGAHGVWAGLSQYPTMFAAGLPFSGIAPPTSDNTTKVAHLGIWYFQGEIDPSPSKSTADHTIQALRNAGGTPVYTVYPNTGHGTWIKAISEPDFFPFMLRYSKLTIHPYFGKTEFNQGEQVSVKLGISPGFQGYEWRKNGVLISGATSNQIIATSLGSYTVRFKRGTIWTEWSEPLVLKLKTPFAISIDTPSPGTLYKGGQTISYSGSGTNSQGDALAAAAFSWQLEFHKPSKIVYVWTRNGSKAGSFVIPSSGETSPDVFYRLILTVTNTDGTKKTTYRDIPPYKTRIILATQPTGLKITLDGTTKITPHSFIAVEGRRRTLGVITPQTYNGKTYKFSGWSQGGSATQTIVVPENDITYTAIFETEPPTGSSVAEIDTPIQGTMYRGGETISYTGSGIGSQGNAFAAGDFTWKLEFHKPFKIVYVWTRTGSSSGSFTIPSSGETSPDVFYRLILTLSDPNGTKKTIIRDISPYLSSIALATNPTGLKVMLDGQSLTTPYSFSAVEGRKRQLDVISTQTLNGKTYKFSNWSQGGAAAQTITVPENNATYTAVFVEESDIVIGPTATISTPIAGTKYKGGQTISYSGNGKDDEGSPLASSALSWQLEFHKPSKIVYVWTRTGTSSGTFTIPSSGETSASVFYRLILTVTDPEGAKATTYRDIPPYTSTVRLATQPAGLQVTLDSNPRSTPYSFVAVEGRRRTMGIVSPQSYGGKSYTFAYWLHGGSASQTFTIPASDITYTAVYELNTSAMASNQTLLMKSEDEVLLFPNPTTDYLKVSVNADLGEKLTMGISNSVGSLLKSITVTAEKQGLNSFDLPVKDLQNSSYTLTIQNKKRAFFKHFIVNK